MFFLVIVIVVSIPLLLWEIIMDIIGSIASTAQITKYLIRSLITLCDVYRQVKLQPDKLQQELGRVERLRSAILKIQTCDTLQQHSVLEQLNSLISNVQVLKEFLDKLARRQSKSLVYRVAKIWINNTDIARLESIWDLIESDKISLLLSLNTETNLQIEQMSQQSKPTARSSEFLSKSLFDLVVTIAVASTDPRNRSLNSAERTHINRRRNGVGKATGTFNVEKASELGPKDLIHQPDKETGPSSPSETVLPIRSAPIAQGDAGADLVADNDDETTSSETSTGNIRQREG